LAKSSKKPDKLAIFVILQDMASITKQPERSKTALLWPLSPPCVTALRQGFGARSTFRPLLSVPHCHLPEVPFPWLREKCQQQQVMSIRLSATYIAD